MLRDLSALWSSTFAVGIIGEDLGYKQDRPALRLSQPLRVESGNATFQWAAGRTLLDQPSAHQHDSPVKADEGKRKQHADMENYLG